MGAGSSCGDRTWEDSEPREALPADSAQTGLGHEWAWHGWQGQVVMSCLPSCQGQQVMFPAGER